MLIVTSLLLLGAALSWLPAMWPATAVMLLAGYGGALALGYVHLSGLAAIVTLMLLASLSGRGVHGVRGDAARAGFFILTVLLTLHQLPGFNDPILIGPVRFTPDATPFTMTLTLDKSAVGFALFMLYRPLYRKAGLARSVTAGVAGAALGLLLLIPLALAFHAVRWEPKLPRELPLWAAYNLLLVAFAEEALFRGLLQATLSRWFEGRRWGAAAAIGLAALAFGAIHYAEGPVLIFFAAVAGIAYGLAYHRGGLLASVIAHFGFNLCHFLLFTYPLLTRHAE